MTYEEYVGLYLNRELARKWLSVAFLEALAADNDGPLDEGWAEALADTPEEAAEVLYEANRARQMARVRKRGSPFE